MTFLDEKYIRLLSPRLEHFKQKSSNLFNVKCPLCGDSKTVSYKTRGYFYNKKGQWSYFCHNCNESMPFWKFLKDQDPYLYSQYQLESFQESKPKEDFSKFVCSPVFEPTKVDIPLPSIKSLSDNHPAKKYLNGRLIPKKFYDDIYYAEKFGDFVSEIFPDHEKVVHNDTRIVFPLRDEESKLIGIQGRAIYDTKVRYSTIKANEYAPKIYGLNRLDKTKDIFVVEGIPDSLFIDNSVAALDGSLWKATQYVPVDKCIFIPDRDVRNKEVMKNTQRLIEKGARVCLLPDDFPGKDLNEAVCNGLTSSVMTHIILNHIYQGLRAKLEFNNWSKV